MPATRMTLLPEVLASGWSAGFLPRHCCVLSGVCAGDSAVSIPQRQVLCFSTFDERAMPMLGEVRLEPMKGLYALSWQY